jgi:hypothetical protein
MKRSMKDLGMMIWLSSDIAVCPPKGVLPET